MLRKLKPQRQALPVEVGGIKQWRKSTRRDGGGITSRRLYFSIATLVSPRLTASYISAFQNHNIDPRAILMMDYSTGFNGVLDQVLHLRVNHSERYADSAIRASTIERLWSLVKRAIAGRHYTVEHTASYIDEVAYKYSIGKSETPWDDFMQRGVA